MTDTVVIAENNDENAGYRFSWGLAIAGGVAATAVTFFLLTLGSGFGLLLVHPATHLMAGVPAFLTGGAIYFFVAQAFGFAVGGHLAGRLLGPQVESRVQEEFRALAHGFIAWAVTILATLIVVALGALTAASTGVTTAALYGATPSGPAGSATPTSYLVDVLFRPATPARSAAAAKPTGPQPVPPRDSNVGGSGEPRAEAARILDEGLARGEQITNDDRGRLVELVALQSGMSTDLAEARIDRLQADVQAKTKRSEEIARKTASYTSLWIAASLLFGALVAMFAALAARNEDDREAVQKR